jgi:iron complex outermembrane receptor protein
MRIAKLNSTLLVTCCAITLLAVAGPATAQSTSDDSVETVVVTAQKRTEKVQDVPISMTVADQAQLERQGIHDISDLNKIAPSLEVNSAPNQNTGGGGIVRGIGTQSFSTTAVGSVGVIVDGVSQGNVPITNIFDIARVEVLAGPQGTLFGETASAGVINIVSVAPDPSALSASIHSELSLRNAVGSEVGRQLVQGVVNLPVSSDSALRLSGSGDFVQGADVNLSTGQSDKTQTYALRGRYLWTPNSDLTVNLIGDYSHENFDGLDFFEAINATPADQSVMSTCGVTAHVGNNKYCSDFPRTEDQTNWGASGQIDYSFGNQTLTSITAYREAISTNNSTDIFGIQPYFLQIQNVGLNSTGRQFSEELRLANASGSTVEYTVGAYYSHYSASMPDNGGGNFVEVGGAPVESGVGGYGSTKITTEAVFGQATWHVADALRLIAGMRYTHEKLDDISISRGGVAAPPPAPAGTVSTASAGENNFSWKAGLQYDILPNLMGYATATEGFKGGQLSDPVTLPATPPSVIKPEVPMDYEAGLKATLLDGKLAVDGDYFYTSVRNFQGQDCAHTITLMCYNATIGNVLTRGFEAEVFGHPFPGLTLNGGLIYDLVKYPGNYYDEYGNSLSGQQLIYAPKWKFTLSGEYEQPINDNLDWFASGSAVYKTKVLEASIANDPNVFFSAHWTLDARLGIRSADGNWDVAIFGRNLTDTHEPFVIFTDFPGNGSYGAIYGLQAFRTVGLTLDYHY